MKKILFTAVLLFAVPVVSAQNEADTYRMLVRNMDKVAERRDSLACVVSALRERYASHEAEREVLSGRIVALEQEIYAAKLQYDKAVAAVAEYEQKNANVQNADAESNVEKDVPTQTEIVPQKQSANLIYNDFFARNLSADDYKMLRSTQLAEQNAQKAVGQYIENHKVMSALQAEYMGVESEQAADSLMTRLNSVRADAETVEENMGQVWQQIYDNKLYCYNLLMEKCGRNDILAYAEQSTEQTAESIERNTGAYFSDALLRYYYQKRALLAYENKIAESLDLSKTKDSLTTVAKTLHQADFLLPKIILQKRYFIEYEPLKVVRPSLYNAKNPIPRTKIYEHGTIYRIRIGIFRMTPNVTAWRGVTPISYSDAYNKGLKAYFAGGFRTEQEADDGVKYLKRLGFRDPVVVMWVDGEYIADPAKWAVEHTGKYNIEIAGVATLPENVRSAILAHKSDCTFSKAGNIFVVGAFAGESAADDIAAEIKAINDALTVKVVKCE